MKISIVARFKQGDILEALRDRGWNQRQGAKFLGLTQEKFGDLINLKWVPKEFSAELTVKLYELTGKMVEDLFPDWAMEQDFLNLPKEVIRTIEFVRTLLEGSAINLSPPPTPEEVRGKEELAKAIYQALKCLSPRQENILKRLMNGESHKEIAVHFNTDETRIRGIQRVAMNKLRSPEISHDLREHL